jgi:hypothetical protein
MSIPVKKPQNVLASADGIKTKAPNAMVMKNKDIPFL